MNTKLTIFFSLIAICAIAMYFYAIPLKVGAFYVFKSGQVGSSPSNGYILSTDGTESTWIANSGGSAFPFTPQTWGNSTSTVIGFTQGIIANASTTLSYLGTGAVYTDAGGRLFSHATTATSVAYQDVWRDGNANIFSNNLLSNGTLTVSAGGTTVLTAASSRFQALTGSSAQTYQLPDATTLSLGPWFVFNNNSSQSLTVTNAGGSTIYTVPAGGITQCGPTSIATSNGSWDCHSYVPSTATWGTGTSGLIFNTALSSSPQIMAGASSATAPSFIPQRTANTTGLGGDGSGLFLTTAGTAKLTVLSGGNVGIGTTSPYKLFSIGGDVVIGASTAGGTLGDLYLPKLGTPAGTLIAVDANGKVIATSSSAGGVTSVTGTYPVVSTGGAIPAISLAFGTTTSNTWANTQTFTNSPVFSTLSAGTVNSLANGTLYATGTSTPSLAGEFTYSGTLGQFIGGSSGSLSLTTNGTALTKLAQIAANTILGNNTGAVGNVVSFATSTLGIAISDTTGTLLVPRGGTGQTTFTSSQLLYGNGTNALSSVATSSGQCTSASGITCSAFTVVGSVSPTFALSAIPNSSLSNSTISGVALGGTLGALTATNGSLTFSGSYDGSTARTVGLNLANANTFTALQQFNGNASTTGFTNSGQTWLTALGTPAGTFLAVDANGKVIATTSPSGGSGAVGSGTTGQFPYYASAGTSLTATSSLFISASGNIGVGTSSPQKLLHVEGNQAGGVARIQRDSGVALDSSIYGTYDIMLNQSTTTNALANYTGPAQTFSVATNGGPQILQGSIASFRDNSDFNGGLILNTYNAGTAYTALTIDSNQRVGIGSSTPYALLSLGAPAGTRPYFSIGSSTQEVFKISGSSAPNLLVGTTTSFSSTGVATFTAGGTGTTTINFGEVGGTGKAQYNMQTDAGATVCAYIHGTSWVIQSGKCN